MTSSEEMRGPLDLPPGTELSGMFGQRYVIREKITEGMQGVSYKAGSADATDETTFFVKTPYTDSNRLPEALQDRNGRIWATFTREFQNRRRLAGIDGVAPILDVGITERYLTAEVPILVPFIVQQFVPGDPLNGYLAMEHPAEDGQFRGIGKYEDWVHLARSILLVLKGVHNRNVVHGDIWPSNIVMAEGGQPWLVDFGSSFLLDQDFQRTGGDTRRHNYLAPERLHQSHAWYLPADIFSMGALLFYMACGRPPDIEVTHNHDVGRLKKYILAELNKLRPEFLRQNVGAAKIIDKCLRYDSSDRFPYVESILDALDVFDVAPTSQSIQQSKARIDAGIKELGANVEGLRRSGSIMFMDYAARQVEMLSKQVEAMSRGTHELIGAREDLINSLLRYLGALGRGHNYFTVTVPAYWRRNNLGTDGRFLAMNKLMVLRGVNVKRVFLLCDKDREDPETMTILTAHLDACQELGSQGVTVFDKETDPGPGERVFYTGYKLVTPGERDSFISSGDQVAIWRGPDDETTMSMKFTISSDGREDIGKIRFWYNPSQESVLRKIEQQISDSSPLNEYLEGTIT